MKYEQLNSQNLDRAHYDTHIAELTNQLNDVKNTIKLIITIIITIIIIIIIIINIWLYSIVRS